jgi:hypothetical protein
MTRSLSLPLALLCACSSVTPADPDVLDAAAEIAAPTEDSATMDAASAPDAPAVAPNLATDLTVSSVAVFQGVRVAVHEGDALVPRRNAPVIAGRPGALRAYVTPNAGFRPREVTAELLWDDGSGAVVARRETRMISAPSSDAAPASVFTFQLDAASVRATSRYAVRVLDPSGQSASAMTANAARAPRDGSLADLGAVGAAGATRVTLVPVRWTRDGSNRLPDTSPEQLQRFRALLLALYPLTAVELTVHAPIDFGTTTLTGNVNFGALNGVLETLRDREAPASDVYYYALVAPAVSRAAYCGRSCVTGQSYVVNNVGDASIRVGSGVGFSGDENAWTFAHELGHLFGRSHAPCSTSGADSNYPYRNAALGVWGWDARSNAFFDPTMTTDFMGYCDPQWVSDYTYRALFERASALRPAPMAIVDERALRAVHVVALSENGSLAYSHARRMSELPRGASRVVARYFDAAGAEIAQREATVAPLGEAVDGVVANVFVPSVDGARSVSIGEGRVALASE